MKGGGQSKRLVKWRGCAASPSRQRSMECDVALRVRMSVATHVRWRMYPQGSYSTCPKWRDSKIHQGTSTQQ